jgi:hypothetical protein
MSFSQTVNKSVDDVVVKYIDTIAQKYNLSKNELLNLWNGKENTVQVDNNTDNNGELDPIYLAKCLKGELVKLCKERGLRTTGTKTDLIAVLQGNKPPSTKKSSPKTANNLPNIIKQIKVNIPTVPIRKNKFGNMEDPQTNFVFDRKSKKVIGKQNINGNIDELTKEDINICNKEKYDYILPSNFDKQTTLEDETVEELEDEEILDDDLEDELDEEELLEDDAEEDEDEEEFEEEFVYED